MTQQPRHGVGLVDRVGITCLCEWTTTFGSGGWPRFNEHLAEASAPDPVATPLDVERLAKALHEVLCITQPTQPPRERLWHVQEAKDIAAAYESLGQPVAEESA